MHNNIVIMVSELKTLSKDWKREQTGIIETSNQTY